MSHVVSKSRENLLLTFLLALAVVVTGCGGHGHGHGHGHSGAGHGGEPESAAATELASATDAATEPQSVWQAGGLTVTARRNAPEFPTASLEINSIEHGAHLESGAAGFDFTVSGYELGTQTSDAAASGLANSADGQHIHLILDNGPYSAHYEPTFTKEFEDGYYVALAFLSRSYHESVKNSAAAVLWDFTVGEAGVYDRFDPGAQHLFYSRPKGSYKGADTEKLMLDFYLVNTTLAPDGNKVRAKINGTELVFSEWIPYLIEGLPLGEVEIQLELIDAEGNLIPGPFNSVTRTVSLVAADDAG